MSLTSKEMISEHLPPTLLTSKHHYIWAAPVIYSYRNSSDPLARSPLNVEST